VKVTPFAGLLFAVFIGIAIREPQSWRAIVAAMLAMLTVVLVVALLNNGTIAAALAIAGSCAALMALHPPLWTLIALPAVLFIALFAVAWLSRQHLLAVLAVPFYVAMVMTANSGAPWAQSSAWTLLAIGVVPYLLFVAYPMTLGSRAEASLDPFIAAALASLVMLAVAWTARPAVDPWHRWMLALVPLAQSAVMAVLLWRALRGEAPQPRRTALLPAAPALFY